MAKPPKQNEGDRWVIRCIDKKGYKGWYGQGARCVPAVMSYLGNAYRYATESEARHAADLARRRVLAAFIVEELPEPVRFKKNAEGTEGST